jgi:asparagine synthase (glutamine-hydrolysing)
MCGIAGIVSGTIPRGALERATEALAHRGPDDSGTVVLRSDTPEPVAIGLGSRRLAILDLSPLGHQPMHDPATGNWIVYNGETYNFRELRSRLESLGAQFQGHSDTEVLLKAYGAWGAACLGYLRGMFAFAIWDARQQKLFLARDPVGIKPLYYFSSDKLFVFASEVRALLATNLVPRRLNTAGIANYLTFGSVYDPDTLIENVHALLPGHSLEWGDGRLTDVQYWDYAASTQNGVRDDVGSRSHAAKHVEDLLHEAVEGQTVSDVPLGVFLSGGIDSSSLVAMLSRTNPGKVSTFSLAFRETDYNESEYCRAIAQRFHTDHHESVISQREALECVPNAIRAMDQPTMDGVNTYLVAKKTREAGITVALSGLGGDEMFAGYSTFRTVPALERFARWKHWIPAKANHAIGSRVGHALAAMYPGARGQKLAALISENGRLIHPYFLSRMLFVPAQRERLLKDASHAASEAAGVTLRETLRAASTFDPINRVSYLEARCYMQNILLRDADCMSMAHGLEVRVPLLDHKLAEFLFTLPGDWKLDSRTPKPLLVKATSGALPDAIVRRKKRGFTLPFERWMRDEMRGDIEKQLCSDPKGPLADVLAPDAPRAVWEQFMAGKTSWSRPWALYVLQRWCELNF